MIPTGSKTDANVEFVTSTQYCSHNSVVLWKTSRWRNDGQSRNLRTLYHCWWVIWYFHFSNKTCRDNTFLQTRINELVFAQELWRFPLSISVIQRNPQNNRLKNFATNNTVDSQRSWGYTTDNPGYTMFLFSGFCFLSWFC